METYGRVIEEENTVDDALFVLCSDPDGIRLTEPLVRARGISIIRTNLTKHRARKAARLLRENNVLSTDEIGDIVAKGVSTLFASAVSYDDMLKWSSEMGWPEIETSFYERLVDDCIDSDFNVANKSIPMVQKLSDADTERIPDQLKSQYVINIAQNASRHNSSNEADKLLKNGLGKRTLFIDSLISELTSPETKIAISNIPWKQLAEIGISSGRMDLIHTLLAIFELETMASHEALTMFKLLKRHPDQAISEKAETTHNKLEDRLFNAD